ncbi:MFS transporter [Phenylobacterium sp.]|uniref:MFS transporter n=1 Tax=Phenylobacterium sp. TaxID=1871053 RepID=UPI0025CE0839|nr:MFS transporter [Phenylobacterium sp.]
MPQVLAPGAPQSLTVAAFLFGLGSGGVGMVLWGAFSDVVARDARGREGMAYGVFTATAKVALAMGGLGLGAALESFDYRDVESDGLLGLMSLIPAGGAPTAPPSPGRPGHPYCGVSRFGSMNWRGMPGPSK